MSYTRGTFVNKKKKKNDEKLPEPCDKKDGCMSYSEFNPLCNETPELCGWNKLKEAEPEKIPNCHGCGTVISDRKYWCVKCLKDSENLWEKPYYELIDGFILKLNNFYARHIIHHKRDSEIFKDFCELIGEYEGMPKK